MNDKKLKVKWTRDLARDCSGTGNIALRLYESKFNLCQDLFIEESEIKNIFIQAIRFYYEHNRNEQFNDDVTETEEFIKLLGLVDMVLQCRATRQFNHEMKDVANSNSEDVDNYDLTRLYSNER